MTKKLALKINNDKIKNAVVNYFRNKDVEIIEDSNSADITALYNYRENVNSKSINLHPSLLPAFKTDEAIKDSYLYGVKVSGITIHSVENENFYGKIIAQIPILIGNDTHFDEFENEIIELSAKIYPKVIETLLNDKVFDFGDLFKHSCNSGCSNCSGCQH